MFYNKKSIIMPIRVNNRRPRDCGSISQFTGNLLSISTAKKSTNKKNSPRELIQKVKELIHQKEEAA